MKMLQHLRREAALGPLELQLWAMFERLEPEVEDDVQLAGALASRAQREGHVCIDLHEVVTRPLFNLEGEPIEDWAWPEVDTWVETLHRSILVGAEAPLRLQGTLLYLGRYATLEASVATTLEDLARRPAPTVDHAALDAMITSMFPGTWANPEQQAAVHAAASSALFVLAGGPGTGKTTTVVRLLAALIDQSRRRGDDDPEILLLAPTGKAAARMAESIRSQKADHLAKPPIELAHDLLEAIPETASTLHRALGARPGWHTSFSHNAARPLPADIVLVDEVSMVDLPMLARTLTALRPSARLILLGDPEQLPSVGVGAVLGDICRIDPSHPVGRCVHTLTASRRYAKGGPVGRLALAMHDPAAPDRGPDLPTVRAVFGEETLATLRQPRVRLDRDKTTLDLLAEGWRPFCAAEGPAARLEALDGFRVLCATRVGPGGVERLGRAIESRLEKLALVPRRRRGWFHGQPILITANDYDTQLYNGDTGVILRQADGSLRAWFPNGEEPRSVPPARLPRHETVWAMTIHKSQGSEFTHVAVVLPDKDHKVLGRELLYTAVTRAKEQVTLLSSDEILELCLLRKSERVSGLSDRLQV